MVGFSILLKDSIVEELTSIATFEQLYLLSSFSKYIREFVGLKRFSYPRKADKFLHLHFLINPTSTISS